jgi:hypothetical protein
VAARKQNWHPDAVREKIKTSQLVNRLNSFAEGKIELTSQQVRAIEILLKKTVPDLSAVHAQVDQQTVQFVVMGVPEAKSPEEWEQKHSSPTVQ